MFKNLNLSTKLIGQLVIQLLLLSLCGIAGISGLKSVFENQKDISNRMVPGMNYLRAASVDIHQALLAERVLCVADAKSDEFKNQLKDYEKNMGQADKRYKKFLALNKDTDLRSLIATFESSYQSWVPFSRKIVAEAVNGKNKADLLAKSLGAGFGLFDKMESSLDKIADTAMEQIITKTGYSASRYNTTLTFLYGIILASIIGGMLVSYFLYRNIFSTLGGEPQLIADMAKNIANGNLRSSATLQGGQAVGLYASMLTMSETLREMVTNVLENSQHVTDTSGQLSSVFQQLAKGVEQTSNKSNTVATAAEEMSANANAVAAATEQAATNVNMVAAAAEEMTSTINDISNNTNKTSEMTEKASEQSASASQRVNELGKAAQEINKVTETITEISEQTNLLALNATIEAARAGEAGKGFAVVANEIKELAKQTSEATLEIKNKIASVQQSTDATVSEITQVNQIIGDANTMTSTVATAVQEQAMTTEEISTNVTQASIGIQEVTENVAQISQVAGDIASEIAEVDHISTKLSESSAQIDSSAIELSNLAQELSSVAKRFTV
jgi:methyl-accepting chemotaxis protein